MFVVYDLSCNGLREPHGVTGVPVLSWRLGTDRAGTRQVAWRVVVTSMRTGKTAWDSGRVFGDKNNALYEGDALEPNEQCVWFVTVWNDANEQAHGTPTAFVYGADGDKIASDWPPQRTGIIWTSDECLNEVLEASSAYDGIRGTAAERLVWNAVQHSANEQVLQNDNAAFVEWAWHEVVGLTSFWPDYSRVRMRVPESCNLAFAQGTLMVPQGMLFMRWEQAGTRRILRASLPPGVSATMACGSTVREVGTGQHVIRMDDGGAR